MDDHRELIQRAVEARRKYFAALQEGDDQPHNFIGIATERQTTRKACIDAGLFQPLIEAGVVEDKEQDE